MIKKYRKKPVVVEAIQWTGENTGEIMDFLGESYICSCFIPSTNIYISIKTLEGTMRARKNDYIIKGVNGEFYPCKPDIFQMTYEEV